MRMRLLLGLVAVLALLAAACGGDGGTADETPSEPTDAETTEAAPTEAEPTEAETTEAAADLQLIQEGQLLVGSDIAFEPFEFEEDGEVKGFDIDLMNEIAGRMGVEVEYVNTPFDGIFTALAGGQFDAIISAITITEERDETIDFSEPYFAANQGLAVEAGSDIGGVSDLDGKAVAVQAGTTGLDYANENFSDAEIVEFPTSQDAFNALAGGQVDAVFIDLPVVGAQVEKGDVELAEEVDTGELYGIGIPQGNTALKEAIDGHLADIIDEGLYADIYTTWFEGDVPSQFAQ